MDIDNSTSMSFARLKEYFWYGETDLGIFRDYPYRLEGGIAFFCTAGEATLCYGVGEHRITQNTESLLLPGMTFYMKDMSDDFSVRLFTFSGELFDDVGVGLDFSANAYNFSNSFAVVTGLGLTSYHGHLALSGYSTEYTSTDDNGDSFSLRYSLDRGYSEKQNVFLLTVPVMARYSIPLGDDRYFVAGGLKLGIPVVANAKIKPGTVSTSGHYEYEAQTYDDLFEHGFVNGRPGDQTTRRVQLGIAPMLALETGVRFPLGYNSALSASLYLDYSLSNIQVSNDKQIIEYQSLNPSQFIYNSALSTALVDKISLFSMGVKLGFVF